MNTEQAYINGFIKRAVEHGLSSVEAYQLLKESAEKPGLWANIRAKRARGERPAKPGSEDYPDKKQWDKLTKSAVAAWQRSEGKNPEGGLNAKGRASYKRETGGTLKAPVTESNPKGKRAKRQNSFCSRMCGMKRVNTGAEAQSNPDSRINKSLRRWNCKCGECSDSLNEKIAMTMGHMKGVLRDLKSQGVQIHRTPQKMTKSLADEYQSRLSGVPLLGRYLAKADKKYDISKRLAEPVARKAIGDGVPMAMGDHTIMTKNKHMYLPRNFKITGSGVLSPRAVALHEAGHIEHMLDDPTVFRQLRNTRGSQQYKTELINKGEAIANNNAILRMQQNQVSPELIEKYKQTVGPAFDSYRLQLDQAYRALPEGMNQFGIMRQKFLNKIKGKKPLEGLNSGWNPIPDRVEEFRKPWSPEVGGDTPVHAKPYFI